MTAAPDLPPDTDSYPGEEPEYATVRRLLGLRPTMYASHGDVAHPDQRPCPPWCWVGKTNGEHQHEVEVAHPATATHNFDGIPHIMASCYAGQSYGDGFVYTASIEPHLTQEGQSQPVIRVYLRRGDYEDRKAQVFEEALCLTVTDAAELASALTYLVEVAEHG